MERDAAAGSHHSCGTGPAVFPPAILGPAANTDWSAVLIDKSRFEAIVIQAYDGNVEQAGTDWIRLRWHNPESAWRHCLAWLVDAAGRQIASIHSLSREI